MTNLKILIPTDFSEQAAFASLMVKKLEEKIAVDVHFLHVVVMPDTVTMDSAGNIQTCGEIDVNYVLKQKENAEQKLSLLKTSFSNEINTHLVLGKVTDAILEFSEANHFDLIVMGTKGAWGLKEKLSGSEAQIIARRSKIPVLSIMCDPSNLEFQHILLVHNFKEPAKENVQLLQKIMMAFNSTLHFLQITSGHVAAEKETVKANMEIFARLNDILQYECHVINDLDIENGVIHFNQMNHMDIICIGTKGKGGLFHQSATEKIINHLFKPIISFKLIQSN